jgi:hypothetical protein
MFIRKKQIKGKIYYYLVKSVRDRSHVHQIVLEYLGAAIPTESKLKKIKQKYTAK